MCIRDRHGILTAAMTPVSTGPAGWRVSVRARNSHRACANVCDDDECGAPTRITFPLTSKPKVL